MRFAHFPPRPHQIMLVLSHKPIPVHHTLIGYLVPELAGTKFRAGSAAKSVMFCKVFTASASLIACFTSTML